MSNLREKVSKKNYPSCSVSYDESIKIYQNEALEKFKNALEEKSFFTTDNGWCVSWTDIEEVFNSFSID